MHRLIRTEFRKLASTRLWWCLLLGSLALTALYACLAIAFGDDPGNPTPGLSTTGGQATVFSTGYGAAGPFAAILAAIGATGEYRHRTATATYLATPRRHRVVAAKLAAYALTGLGYAVACGALAFAIAAPWLSAKGIGVSLGAQPFPRVLAGGLVSVALYALLGVGLGALVREQVATVVGLLVYLFAVEPVVTRVPALYDWTKFCRARHPRR